MQHVLYVPPIWIPVFHPDSESPVGWRERERVTTELAKPPTGSIEIAIFNNIAATKKLSRSEVSPNIGSAPLNSGFLSLPPSRDAMVAPRPRALPGMAQIFKRAKFRPCRAVRYGRFSAAFGSRLAVHLICGGANLPHYSPEPRVVSSTELGRHGIIATHGHSEWLHLVKSC